MSFASDLAAFNAKQKRITRELFVNVVNATRDSIVEGSTVTGAPGQLVDTGNLKASWQTDFDSPAQATIGTNVVYALEMEEGTRAGRALVQRSKVGGFHSVEKTIHGFDALVENEARKLGAE